MPVVLPDQAPMSVAILALQRSDNRLLSAALQLGPFIQEAAAQLAASRTAGDAPAAASSVSSSPAKPLTNGTAARKQSSGVLSDSIAADAGGQAGYSYAHKMRLLGPSKHIPPHTAQSETFSEVDEHFRERGHKLAIPVCIPYLTHRFGSLQARVPQPVFRQVKPRRRCTSQTATQLSKQGRLRRL